MDNEEIKMYNFIKGIGLLMEGMALANRTPETDKKLADLLRKSATCIETHTLDDETTNSALELMSAVEADMDDCADCDQVPCTGCARHDYA